jgi:mono/diheme cytochrome c family protein
MRVRPFLVFLAVLLTAAVFFGCAKKEEPKPVAQAQALSADAADGKILLERLCVTCHSLDRITSRKENKEKWAEIIKTMQAKQPGIINDEAAGKILAYLSTLPGK